ncbi:hypothetical protein PHMEG_00034949 [Phytophthora megakarya]|uniref:Uncharacterized protein n=1 Tax=Phytophthora megakarya TaxID=4795 RepID=A0A225USJ4_9STRA|nr:hypothetical protein PHMEG_00034949 [Phytophthora megakarya]
MQTTPSDVLLDQIPRDYFEVEPISVEDTSLRDLIENPRDVSTDTNKSQSAGPSQPTRSAVVPGIHAYVNRILNANGDSNISTPWIPDRGSWSMSAVSKDFNYIVSSTHEDQKVGKSLAGCDLNAQPHLPTLDAFDSPVLQRIRQVQCLLFASIHGLDDGLSLRKEVIEVPMAVTILHYNEMLHLAPASPYIKRVCLAVSVPSY